MHTPIYFTREELPGVQFFRCDRYAATLSVPACSGMWRQANHQNVERLYRCKTCALGAAHAGEKTASMSPLLGVCLCARCHRTAARLIGKHICVSCFNREREWKIGRNAKGQKPVKLPPLEPRSITFGAGEAVQTLQRTHTISTLELIVAALRDSRQRVQFAFRGRPAGVLVQGRLFA